MASTNMYPLWIFSFIITASCKDVYYKTDYIHVPLDHFSANNSVTFKMRYLINDTYWNKKWGPMLIYTGNEGSIETFAKGAGFIWDIAPELKALVVFAEHRYYGKSMPLGRKSFTTANIGYLTSSQAIADYADLITLLLRGRNTTVIAIGGSYGGLLAAYARIKYPKVVHAALAVSAPILQYQGLTGCGVYNEILTSVYSTVSGNCSNNIRKSWPAIKSKLSTSCGKQWMSDLFKPCNALTNSTAENYRLFKDWLSKIYSTVAMFNYPYESDFSVPLPAYPVRALCQHLEQPNLEGDQLIEAISSAISVYTNHTGKKTSCNNIDKFDLDDIAWDYQTCTELMMPMCSNGTQDMFEPQPWNQTEYDQSCLSKWKVKPQHLPREYDLDHLVNSSNIIFTNGLMDPWSGGGIIRTYTSTLPTALMLNDPHQADLRKANEKDPMTVKSIRKFIMYTMRRWINDHEFDTIVGTVMVHGKKL